MAQTMRAAFGIGALGVLAAWLAGCADEHVAGPERPAAPVALLSEPVGGAPPPSPSPAGVAPASAPAAGVAYVALPAGTVPRGARAVIRHVPSGFFRTETMVDGGLDPVAVPAAVGDTIEVAATDSAGATFQVAAAVPVRRPPRVVRTVPAKGRTDVPLNSIMVIIFSEPVSAQTVSAASVRLTSGGAPVGGTVVLSADGLRAELYPDGPLAANTEYTLVVTADVADLSGDRLEEPVEVRFRTGSALATADSVSLDPPAATLAVGEQLQLTARAYHAGRLVRADWSWSTAEPSVAMVSFTGRAGSASPTAVVTGVSLGTSTVMAEAGEAGASATITVMRGVYASISAGGYHTCALTVDGAAYCWGVGVWGQLGNGPLTQEGGDDPAAWLGRRATPAPVVGGLTFTSVSAGASHTCGLATGGVAYCWGANNYGQLGAATAETCRSSGDNLNIDLPCSSVPVPVAGGLRFIAIMAEWEYSCGLTENGAAYCWGFNGLGQLGNGTDQDSPTPALVSGGLTFKSLDTGQWTTCGVAIDGTMYCWGYPEFWLGASASCNPDHEGDFGEGPVRCSKRPVAIEGAQSFATVSQGQGIICGIKAGGAAYCWGAYPASRGSSVPAAIPGGLTFARLDANQAGDATACGLTTGGTAYCWGLNLDGIIGPPQPGGSRSDAPKPVPGGYTFTSFSYGGQHACGVTPGGTAYCWGYGLLGALGNGALADSWVPVKVKGQP